MFDELAALRAEVMAQPAADRVEYALELIGYYLAPVPAFFVGVDALGLKLQNADIRMLHALDVRRGSFVSLHALTAARCLDRPCDQWMDPDRVVKSVAALRKKLEASGLPVKITTWNHVGYCLEAPEWFRFERGADALDYAPDLARGAA